MCGLLACDVCVGVGGVSRDVQPALQVLAKELEEEEDGDGGEEDEGSADLEREDGEYYGSSDGGGCSDGGSDDADWNWGP